MIPSPDWPGRWKQLLRSSPPRCARRVVEALAKVHAPHRSYLRLAAAVGAAAVVLFALGFVPFSTKGHPGALTRAMAAMENAQGVFIHRYGRDPNGSIYETREWRAAGGLWRLEGYLDGKLHDLSVCGRDSLVDYYPDRKAASIREWRHPEWTAHTLFTRSSERHSFGIFKLTTDPQSGVSVREFRESSLWGGSRDIVEVEQPSTIIQGRPGGTIGKWRREFDPTTGRLLSERRYWKEGNSWVLSSWTEEVNWDAEIPEETWTFTPPHGTKVRINNSWWSQHPGDPIWTGRTNDCELTLYSMDRDRTDGLYLAVEPRSLDPGKKRPLPLRARSRRRGGRALRTRSALLRRDRQWHLADETAPRARCAAARRWSTYQHHLQPGRLLRRMEGRHDRDPLGCPLPSRT